MESVVTSLILPVVGIMISGHFTPFLNAWFLAARQALRDIYLESIDALKKTLFPKPIDSDPPLVKMPHPVSGAL